MVVVYLIIVLNHIYGSDYVMIESLVRVDVVENQGYFQVIILRHYGLVTNLLMKKGGVVQPMRFTPNETALIIKDEEVLGTMERHIGALLQVMG